MAPLSCKYTAYNVNTGFLVRGLLHAACLTPDNQLKTTDLCGANPLLATGIWDIPSNQSRPCSEDLIEQPYITNTKQQISRFIPQILNNICQIIEIRIIQLQQAHLLSSAWCMDKYFI